MRTQVITHYSQVRDRKKEFRQSRKQLFNSEVFKEVDPFRPPSLHTNYELSKLVAYTKQKYVTYTQARESYIDKYSFTHRLVATVTTPFISRSSL